ncbi:hypothetical protein CR513_59851, partial [Mucuna pruriens]
ETPFRLTYGSEAVIPVEIGEPSPRTALFDPTANEDELRANLDLLQETREIAYIKEYAVKAKVARRYNRKMMPRDFQEGDLVLRKITMMAEKNKLTPKWEGPFRVAEKVGRGAYRLEHLEGRRIPRTWNAGNLRRRNTMTARQDSRLDKATNPKRAVQEADPGYKPKTGGPGGRPGVIRLRLDKATNPKRAVQEADPGSFVYD